MRFLPSSLRWRIQLWHSLLLLAVLVGFGVAAYHYQAASDLSNLDRELRARLDIVTMSMPLPPRSRRPEPPRPGEAPPPPEEDRPIFRMTAERAALFGPAEGAFFYYQIWHRTGEVWVRSPGAPRELPPPSRPSGATLGLTERDRAEFREVSSFTPTGDILLVGKSMAVERAKLERYRYQLVWLGLGVFTVAVCIGGWLTTRALRPVQLIATSARRIAEGHLEERIPVAEGRSELGSLSEVLNSTFSKLESAFQRQARFTADAAHELRTPVAIILAQAQAALARERDPASYQRTLEICVKASRRLQQLTESLLALATLDAECVILERQPCDLAVQAQEALALLEPLATAQGMRLSCSLAPAPCLADPGRIDQILSNLLINALQYNRPQGSISLTTSCEGEDVLCSVRDEGPGIAAEHLTHVFDRFYRVEASRNRQFGGAGLGLAIAQEIALAHGGSLSVTSTVGVGSEFTLRLAKAP